MLSASLVLAIANTYSRVTNALLMTGIPSSDTILFNCIAIDFVKLLLHASCNKLVYMFIQSSYPCLCSVVQCSVVYDVPFCLVCVCVDPVV